MYKTNENKQDELIVMSMEELVPNDHILRKVSKFIDFSFINEKTKHLYSLETGRNSVEPAALFKIVFLQYLYGIKSMRATTKQCQTDASFRWFLGIPFGKPVPHYSTFSQNYLRRFADTTIFEDIFENILRQAIKHKLVSGRDLFSDSTHVKANANNRKCEEAIVKVAKERKHAFESEINLLRDELGKSHHEFTEEIETKRQKISKTDPESGYYHRSTKEKGFMYLDHRTVDGMNNMIVDVHITPGNVHDSRPYLTRLDYLRSKYEFGVENVALDSGYYSWDIMEGLTNRDIFSAIAYRRFPTNKEDRKNFTYHSENDVYICPIGLILPFRNVDKAGYKHYFDSKQCKGCPMLSKCADGDKKKTIRRHIKQEVYEEARERRLSEHGKELYPKRKITVERSFADSKQNHGYRYATHRGRAKVQNYAWLSCAAQNMKKIALLMSSRNNALITLSLKTIETINLRLQTAFYIQEKRCLLC